MIVRQYRKRPVEIDAVQWDGTPEGATPIIDWILTNGGTARYHDVELVGISPYRPDDTNSLTTPAHIAIDTLEGTMRALADDWVIRGVEGEFYPCKPGIFTATYDTPAAVVVPSDDECAGDIDILVASGYTEIPPTGDVSDGELLTRMGTIAGRWAHEFMRIKHEIEAADDDRTTDDEGWMIGWFANAIEAGRDAGRGTLEDPVFHGMLRWFMASDPWPLGDDDWKAADGFHAKIQGLLDAESDRRGFNGWIDAFHRFGRADDE